MNGQKEKEPAHIVILRKLDVGTNDIPMDRYGEFARRVEIETLLSVLKESIIPDEERSKVIEKLRDMGKKEGNSYEKSFNRVADALS